MVHAYIKPAGAISCACVWPAFGYFRPVWQGDHTLAQKYYFVSDLHMGGDGQLQHCDCAAEFVEFLKELEKEGPDTEFLIVGDTFGFWELTLVRGVERLAHIIQAHQAIFDQLRATGARGRESRL
jgi:hypothetical protein